MPTPRPALFKWRHFEPEIIVCAVRWYLRFSLSYRDVEELLLERGLPADHTTIWRWVQRYAPELNKRCRRELKPTQPISEYVVQFRLLLWLEALAGLKALYDSSNGALTMPYPCGSTKRSPTRLPSRSGLAVTFSTYSDPEVQVIIRKINGCRDRFIKQGGGTDRARCLCSIFQEIKDGNGGDLPRLDD
jgi:hypothetical protein